MMENLIPSRLFCIMYVWNPDGCHGVPFTSFPEMSAAGEFSDILHSPLQ